MRRVAIGVFLLLLASCTALPGQVSRSTAPAPQSSLSPQVTATRQVVVTPATATRAAPTGTATPVPSPEPARAQVCSPLETISLAELPEILTNPFLQPRPGQDDGHHGTDFAFYRHGERGSIQGLGIDSVLSGRVAAVAADRPPYGNMVMLETPIEDLPASFGGLDNLPPLPTMIPGNIRLTCPTPGVSETSSTGVSLYLLYAHMETPPAWKIGDPVTCGQQLGSVGNTGTSTNPHLHLEARIGPSGRAFTSMAHYTTSASPEEMANYCTWRVSGTFRMIDPMQLFASPELN